MTVLPHWPDYARVGATIALGATRDVRRTAFDDGSVRQARVATATWLTRRLAVELPETSLAGFRAWAGAHAGDWFLAPPDPDGGPANLRAVSYSATTGIFTNAIFGPGRRRGRVVGGSGGIAYRQVSRHGRPWWVAEMSVEGPEAEHRTDIFDADLPLGDSTGVYARTTTTIRTIGTDPRISVVFGGKDLPVPG